jgi:hypothetical protein
MDSSSVREERCWGSWEKTPDAEYSCLMRSASISIRHRHRLNETVGLQSWHEQDLHVNLLNATHKSNHKDHGIQQHPVQVNTFHLSILLQSFHDISCILSQRNHAHYLEDGSTSTLMAACTYLLHLQRLRCSSWMLSLAAGANYLSTSSIAYSTSTYIHLCSTQSWCGAYTVM